MNKLANQHNNLINLPLRKFNASELDILLALCYKCQNEDTNEIVLDFKQIRKLAHYRNKNDKKFIEDIKSTNEKLLGLNMTIEEGSKSIQFALFPTFEVDREKETLTVQVHDKFSYLLNDLSEGNYTSLELQQSSSLRSTYAKGIYKKLRKERDRGKWIVTAEDFREYLDIPKSYKSGDINKRVINPSIEELKPFFPGLECNAYYDNHKKGRGRPAIAGYIFSFKEQPHEGKEKQPSVKQIAEKTSWEKLGKYCPVCHQEVWKKHMTNENGEYWMIGHPDFKTGGCNWKSNSFGDALSSDDINRLEAESAEPITETEKENARTIKGLLKNIFS